MQRLHEHLHCMLGEPQRALRVLQASNKPTSTEGNRRAEYRGPASQQELRHTRWPLRRGVTLAGLAAWHQHHEHLHSAPWLGHKSRSRLPSPNHSPFTHFPLSARPRPPSAWSALISPRCATLKRGGYNLFSPYSGGALIPSNAPALNTNDEKVPRQEFAAAPDPAHLRARDYTPPRGPLGQDAIPCSKHVVSGSEEYGVRHELTTCASAGAPTP